MKPNLIPTDHRQSTRKIASPCARSTLDHARLTIPCLADSNDTSPAPITAVNDSNAPVIPSLCPRLLTERIPALLFLPSTADGKDSNTQGDQPHCGFPEKNFSVNLEKLARKGYRVLVVEQTETPEQLELRRKEMGTKDKASIGCLFCVCSPRVVKREICAVVSKGTLIEGEALLVNPEISYLMSITEKVHNFDEHHTQGTTLGVCVVDVSTSKFTLGQFYDNLERDCLCSLLSELRPVEIIKPSKVLSPETERILMQNTRNPLVNDLVPSSEFWNAEKTILEIKKIYSSLKYSGKSGMMDDTSNVRSMEKYLDIIPDILIELDSAGQNGCLALSALGGCLFYLRQAFLDETLLKCANFEALPCAGSLNMLQKPYMILDAAALENLEILEDRNGNPAGTLYTQLDHCVTAFGKRLLKSWLVRPLHDINSIVARQDAVLAFKFLIPSDAYHAPRVSTHRQPRKAALCGPPLVSPP
ncbi:DNA mismatch repair protein MSH6 [Platanthera guangdongensis]|uniref:DNA mismatch repair protein MSH6 n=1 Tax=Platanthera guangdongensis TaxID=2320717 RepID=A0ABR2M3X2_9ASPA